MVIDVCFPGLHLWPRSVQKCFIPQLRIGSEGSCRVSIMRSRPLILLKWSLMFSENEQIKPHPFYFSRASFYLWENYSCHFNCKTGCALIINVVQNLFLTTYRLIINNRFPGKADQELLHIVSQPMGIIGVPHFHDASQMEDGYGY